MEFQDRFLALFCLFSVVTASDGSGSHRKVIKESHYYSVNDGVPQDTLIGPTFFIHKWPSKLCINDLSDDVICMYADDMLDSKSDQAPDLWEQLEWIGF